MQFRERQGRSRRAAVELYRKSIAKVPAALRARPGLAAAAAALSAQRLLRFAEPAAPFPPYSLANRLIRHAPGSWATRGIELLGNHAQQLIAAIAIATFLLVGFALGRRAAVLFGGLAVLVSVAAGLADPVRPGPGSTLEAGAAGGLAAFVAAWLIEAPVAGVARPFDPRRRRLFAASLAAGGLAGLGGLAVLRRSPGVGADAVRADHVIAVPDDPRFPAVPGLSPRITPPRDHYVVDINLTDPVVDGRSWRLAVHGAVAAPLSLSLTDLRAMGTVEQPILLECISNPVGGRLAGDARWTGVPLARILDLASPGPSARAIRATAADGYVETLPIEVARQEDLLVVFGMNALLLPARHGFPARLIHPGRYGMRSVKWLTEIEVVGDTGEEGYWEKRGWDREAVMRTGARFDIPANHAEVHAPFVAAGVAWAGTRGVGAVEVSGDEGASWTAARLESETGVLGWRRWQAAFDLPPGSHALQVRAADGLGDAQDAERRPPHPSGASGYHRITVTVV